MLKKFLTLIITLIILATSTFVFAESGNGDTNTDADNTITDTINWLASNEYTIDNGYVLGVKNGITTSEFLSNFYNSGENVRLYDSTSSALVDADTVLQTGMIVKHIVSLEECAVIVSGDVDGNGLVNSTDILNLTSHIIGTSKIKENTINFKAADIDSSNTVTIVDVANIRNIILN